jgi:hypothetical protein
MEGTMTDTDTRTTYFHATGGEYDKAHEQELARVITEAIIQTSLVSDANAVVVRTGEISEALIATLACALAMSPSVTRSPTAIRRTTEDIAKRLYRRIVAAKNDPDLRDFVRRSFSGNDIGGNA